jgi:hypothetical protein
MNRLGPLAHAAAAAWAQQQGPIEPRRPTAAPGREPREATLRVGANLVLRPATVTDSFNRPVVGLGEKTEQKITHFGMADGLPCR